MIAVILGSDGLNYWRPFKSISEKGIELVVPLPDGVEIVAFTVMPTPEVSHG